MEESRIQEKTQSYCLYARIQKGEKYRGTKKVQVYFYLNLTAVQRKAMTQIRNKKYVEKYEM